MRNIIICDLDGTLADITHRLHFIQRDPTAPPDPSWKQDWPAFHKACTGDAPIDDTLRVLEALTHNKEYDLWIVTGRSEAARPETEAWLAKHLRYWDRLVMRPVGDYTPDHLLKHLWCLNGHIPPAPRILCVFEDRERVVDMWRKLGLTCYHVAKGDF